MRSISDSLRDVRRTIQFIQDRIGYIQTHLLPRAQQRLVRSEQLLSESIGRSLTSTQRLLDPPPSEPPETEHPVSNSAVRAVSYRHSVHSAPTSPARLLRLRAG